MQVKDEKCFAVAAGTPASLIQPQMADCKAAQIIVSAMEAVCSGSGVREREGEHGRVRKPAYDVAI